MSSISSGIGIGGGGGNFYGNSAAVYEMNQLKELNKEITRVQVHLKGLKKTKKEIEARILKFLDEHNLNGAKAGDFAVLEKERTIKVKRKPTDKISEISSVLASAGVRNTEETVNKVLEALKGEETTKKTLVYQTPKLKANGKRK